MPHATKPWFRRAKLQADHDLDAGSTSEVFGERRGAAKLEAEPFDVDRRSTSALSLWAVQDGFVRAKPPAPPVAKKTARLDVRVPCMCHDALALTYKLFGTGSYQAASQ